MVKCRIRPGRKHTVSETDSDGNVRSRIAHANEIIEVSNICAERFPDTLERIVKNVAPIEDLSVKQVETKKEVEIEKEVAEEKEATTKTKSK